MLKLLKLEWRYSGDRIMTSRIGINDNTATAVAKLVDCNPGAVRVCGELFHNTKKIDPDSALDEMDFIISLDTLEIYGPRIWMLYKDVCQHDIAKVMGLIKAYQFGFMTKAELDHAIDNNGEGIDVDSLVNKVKERLPNFGKLV